MSYLLTIFFFIFSRTPPPPPPLPAVFIDAMSRRSRERTGIKAVVILLLSNAVTVFACVFSSLSQRVSPITLPGSTHVQSLIASRPMIVNPVQFLVERSATLSVLYCRFIWRTVMHPADVITFNVPYVRE